MEIRINKKLLQKEAEISQKVSDTISDLFGIESMNIEEEMESAIANFPEINTKAYSMHLDQTTGDMVMSVNDEAITDFMSIYDDIIDGAANAISIILPLFKRKSRRLEKKISALTEKWFPAPVVEEEDSAEEKVEESPMDYDDTFCMKASEEASPDVLENLKKLFDKCKGEDQTTVTEEDPDDWEE